MIENKSINNQTYFLGQYMTPSELANSLLEGLTYDENCVYVEPSFGTSNFIKSLNNHGVPLPSIVGCELDSNLFDCSIDLEFEKYNINFYDWTFKTNKKIIFIGNPPFRTPAMSLRSHPSIIKKLCKKYNVKGIREEAVFFLLRCLEIIEENAFNGCTNLTEVIIPQSVSIISDGAFYGCVYLKTLTLPRLCEDMEKDMELYFITECIISYY